MFLHLKMIVVPFALSVVMRHRSVKDLCGAHMQTVIVVTAVTDVNMKHGWPKWKL